MKISWGTGIAVFYTLFVIVMVGMVVYSRSFDNSLVVENYYEKDLAYQSHIDKVKNSQQLKTDLTIIEDSEHSALLFQFPLEFSQIAGEILFYRADDKSKDFSVKIQPGKTGEFSVSTEKVPAGRWTVKVDWQGDGKPFYKEEMILL